MGKNCFKIQQRLLRVLDPPSLRKVTLYQLKPKRCVATENVRINELFHPLNSLIDLASQH